MAATDVFPFDPWLEGMNQASVIVNDNALRTEVITGPALGIESTQPGSPADDDQYILGSAPSGAQWASFAEDDVVIFKGGTWYAFDPYDGWLKFNADDGDTYQFTTSGGWAVFAGGGGGGSVAGSDKQVQFNDGGAFGAEAGFEYDKTTNTLTVDKVNEARGSSISSATTTDIGAATGNFVHITGTTTITGFGTVAAGSRRLVVFDGALTLTHNGTSLILPTGANITTAAGDAIIAVSEGSGNWRVTHYQKKDGSALSGGGGSITGFTTTLETSSPNATVNVSKMLASGGTTNQDAAFTPKGTGAILGQTPDSSTPGGNKRGARAVDLQLSRGTATQVAAGADSVISGGASNSASGQYDTVSGGLGNTAGGGSATVGGGTSNSISSQYGTISGGNTNVISGGSDGGTIIGGANNLVSGPYGTAGGQQSTTRGAYGAEAYASRAFSVQGDGQRRNLVLLASTTNATPAVATSNLSTAASTNQFNLSNDCTLGFRAIVIARNNATGDSARWIVEGLAKRVSGTVTLVGTATVTMTHNDSGASTWVLAVTADNTNKTVAFGVTGVAATSIKWVVRAESVEVVG